MGIFNSIFNLMGKAGSKGFNEAGKVLTGGKNPIQSALDIKKSLSRGRPPKIPNNLLSIFTKYIKK